MRTIRWADLEQDAERVGEPVALTVGVFDGLHIGHQKLIQAIRSGEENAVPLVLTFTRSPVEVLAEEGLRPGPPPGASCPSGRSWPSWRGWGWPGSC